MKRYRPSNGTEGEIFIDNYCMQCINCDPDPCGEKQCEIMLRTLLFDLNDPEYPEEWIVNDEGFPVCTAWQKWDWGKDDDPDKPRTPPPVPPPPVPNNQLMLFTDFDEIIYTKQKEYQR